MSTQEQETVPRALQPRFEAATLRTDAFCEEYLDDDYAALCRRMAAALARKRPSPLERGGVDGWACGAKARAVEDALNLRRHDWTWMVPAMIERSPLVWLVEVDGIPIDARELPRGVQEDAFSRGLIPYVPARRPEHWPADRDELALPAMSGILIDVAEPLLESIREDAPLDEYLGALRFAADIWNASRHPSPADGDLALLKDALVDALGTTPEDADTLVATFYDHARELHPDETREIRDVDVRFEGDELRVRVVSVFPEDA